MSTWMPRIAKEENLQKLGEEFWPQTPAETMDSGEKKAADYSGDAGDYGHWRPKRCHPHCMPHCLPTCRPCPCLTCPCPRPPVWNRRTAIGEGEDYGHWPPKPPCGCPTCPCPPRPCGCS